MVKAKPFYLFFVIFYISMLFLLFLWIKHTRHRVPVPTPYRAPAPAVVTAQNWGLFQTSEEHRQQLDLLAASERKKRGE